MRRLLEPFVHALLDQQSIDDDFNGVIASLVEFDLFVELANLSVDSSAIESGAREFLEFFLNSPFRPRTMGARIITRSPSGSVAICWTI